VLDGLPALEEVTLQLEEQKHEYIPAITSSFLRLPAALLSLKVIHQYFNTVIAHQHGHDLSNFKLLASACCIPWIFD
jgi:hypothetical protein